MRIAYFCQCQHFHSHFAKLAKQVLISWAYIPLLLCSSYISICMFRYTSYSIYLFPTNTADSEHHQNLIRQTYRRTSLRVDMQQLDKQMHLEKILWYFQSSPLQLLIFSIFAFRISCLLRFHLTTWQIFLMVN